MPCASRASASPIPRSGRRRRWGSSHGAEELELRIPDFSLVVLIGASGSGKSSFAARHFLATEVLSSDRCRGWVSDDETDQGATKDAFEILHFIAGKRLAARRLTVVDATNVRPEDRKLLVELARRYHALPITIVIDIPEETCSARNKDRADRQFGAQVVRNQVRLLRKSLRGLQREGFRHVFTLSSVAQVEEATIVRDPLYTDRRTDHGP